MEWNLVSALDVCLLLAGRGICLFRERMMLRNNTRHGRMDLGTLIPCHLSLCSIHLQSWYQRVASLVFWQQLLQCGQGIPWILLWFGFAYCDVSSPLENLYWSAIHAFKSSPSTATIDPAELSVSKICRSYFYEFCSHRKMSLQASSRSGRGSPSNAFWSSIVSFIRTVL